MQSKLLLSLFELLLFCHCPTNFYSTTHSWSHGFLFKRFDLFTDIFSHLCCFCSSFTILLCINFVEELIEILIATNVFRIEYCHLSILYWILELCQALLLDFLNFLPLILEFCHVSFCSSRQCWITCCRANTGSVRIKFVWVLNLCPKLFDEILNRISTLIQQFRIVIWALDVLRASKWETCQL